jgi:hypothetical protein
LETLTHGSEAEPGRRRSGSGQLGFMPLSQLLFCVPSVVRRDKVNCTCCYPGKEVTIRLTKNSKSISIPEGAHWFGLPRSLPER